MPTNQPASPAGANKVGISVIVDNPPPTPSKLATLTANQFSLIITIALVSLALLLAIIFYRQKKKRRET